MTDEQREAYIADCGRRMLAAHAAGDLAVARRWLDLEMAAIKERSPTQVALLEACFFTAQGDRARALVQGTRT